MNNLIEYDGFIIGYKNDLIKHLEEEMTRLRQDTSIDNEELVNYINQTQDAIKILNEMNNFYLIGVGEGVMGDLVVKHVGIELESDKNE